MKTKKIESYKDIYKFPLSSVNSDYYSQVYDSNDNFVFQFTFHSDKLKEKAQLILSVINGDKNLESKDVSFKHSEGYILDNKEQKLILIRGWGNLTGCGAHNLKPEIAANIQDTFADFIVERLNTRK